MAKTKQQKEAIVAQYRDKLKGAKALYFVRPSGITPNQTSALKKELAEVGAQFNVVKNTLFKIALKDESLPEVETLASGEHAVLYSADQVSEAAKVLQKHIKETEKMEIVAGLLNGEEITAVQVKDLAELPSKDQLIAQLLSVFNGPARGMVTVLSGNMREMVQVLSAIKDEKATT
ncbi:MAG: 50S ribosomal protein L10 [Candidatus Dojkabacteria bacterium]